MKRRSLLLSSLVACATSASAQRAAAAASYVDRQAVQDLIAEAERIHGLERDVVEAIVAAGRYSAEAERLMTPNLTPAPRNWEAYRSRVLDDRRLTAGLAFWQAHAQALDRAGTEFGVPPEIVVSIIGVETMYGRHMGRFRILDVLLTLSFDYPRRADFYREQLLHFLVLASDGRLNPLTQTGSFAGAIGLPQFMPGSIRQYALDYDQSGNIDLSHSPVDAIGSVANYLREVGWQRELPIQFSARADESAAEALGRGIVAKHPWGEVAERGVRIDGYLVPDEPILLVDLPTPGVKGQARYEYRVGTRNFAAILHYNRSYFYAASVADFAELLRRRIEPSSS